MSRGVEAWRIRFLKETRMKKNLKKLKLSRETVRHLSGPTMPWVVGAGSYTDPGITTCSRDDTQTSGYCPSAFCGSVSCMESCICDQSNGLYACVPPG
jgi:hypothetical protein